MKLSNYTQGRDNNFNLLRILAAYAVLVTHSFALATGREDAEPFRGTLGVTLGTIAVDIFFVTSGFLVTGSLFTRQSTLEFIWARTLRIFPALVVMVLLTVFALGSYFTMLPWASYITKSATWKYVLNCSTLFAGVQYELPGVFESNPYEHAVNGSLWTMPYEVYMYALLAITWSFSRIVPKSRLRVFEVTIISCALIGGALVALAHFNVIKERHFMRLLFMFFTGAVFFVLRARILLSRSILYPGVVVLLLSAFNKEAFFVIYSATLAYLLFYAAYIPAGVIRNYNRLGDYSYGVYIYAFPVQQSIIALFPGISVFATVAISTVVTFVLAALSWHLLEKHALRAKGRSVVYTRKLMSFGGAEAK